MEDGSVRTELLRPGGSLPMVVTPTQGKPDAAEWAASHREWIEARLRQHGALLLRGFKPGGVEPFEALVRAISPELPTFDEESSPRTQLSEGVYTSTDHPPAYPIQFHNEYSYGAQWPMKLFFCCLLPASRGGETPIADVRGVLGRLRPETREQFRTRKILYVRNYNNLGMGVRWQTAFQTTERAKVEAYCRSAGIEFEWGEGEALRTRQRGEALVRHPRTGEELWFNHGFFFNVRALEPESARTALLETCAEKDLSTNTYFGDGGTIPDEVIEELRRAYQAEAVAFPWQRGDVLLIDNMLTAHARAPYSGPRKVLVAMSEAFRRDALPST